VDISTQFPANVWHDRFLLGDEIGRALAFTSVVLLVFYGLVRSNVLRRLFAFFTIDGEMLFIGTMAYNIGASALAQQMGVSPIIGAYFAGTSLATLPSRHQINHKISSLRGFGMTTFYFMMGIYVKLDGDFATSGLIWWSFLISAMNVLVSPVIMMLFGFSAKLKTRTALSVSLLSNSLGESTLTLQVLAFEAGIFTRETFLVLVISTLLSVVMCCILTMFVEPLFRFLMPILEKLDDPRGKEKERLDEFRAHGGFKNHVVILGWNETGYELAEHFREKRKVVIVIDLDPKLHEVTDIRYAPPFVSLLFLLLPPFMPLHPFSFSVYSELPGFFVGGNLVLKEG